MAEQGTTLLTLPPVQIVTPGTAVKIPTSGEKFAGHTVLIQALPENEEAVVIGDVNVKAKIGSHTTPEQRGIELEKKQSVAIEVNDSSQIYLDGRKAKDGVAVTILLA